MALGKVFAILVVVAIVFGDHEVEKEGKEKKAVASEKDQKYRSANPGRGSFQKLSSLFNNRTENRHRKSGEKWNKELLYLNKKYNDTNMLNDNEGSITVNQKSDNDSLSYKLKVLRPNGSMYEPVNRYNYVSQATGVYCSFENGTQGDDTCMWQWNSTVSSHGLGFRVMTADDLVKLNQTTRGMKFTGPATDADNNPRGGFWCCVFDVFYGFFFTRY